MLRPSASRRPCASAAALSLASAAAFASASNSALASRILSARPLLIGNPIRHLLAGLVAAMQLVLRGIRRLGRAEPLGDLGFQLPGALFHTLVAHRLVLRGVGFDLGAIERHMPELDETGLLAQLQNLPEQFAKRLQVTPAEIRDGTEIRWIEPDNAHEIDAFAACLGDAA